MSRATRVGGLTLGCLLGALLIGPPSSFAQVFLASKPEPEFSVGSLFIVLLLATVLGAPVFTALGGAALILFWGEGVPIASIPVETYRLTVSPTLPISARVLICAVQL